jgi:outer membrane protein assembly factor BamB
VFLDPVINEQISSAGNNMGWGQMAGGLTNAAPAAVADQRRVYLNWYGIVWAVDLDSGKVAWWSEPFKSLSENNKAQMLVQFMVDQRRFAVVLAGDNLLTVAVRLDRLQNQEPFRLNCLEAATGKKKWSSESGSLSGWGFLGSPLVIGDTIYIIAHPRENQQLSLLAIGLSGGQLLWSRELGQPQLVNGWNGMPVYPVPALKYDQGFIYVMTNNGATIAVEAATHSIAWSFSYDVPYQPQQENGMMVINGMWVRAGAGSMMEAGASFLHDGKLIFKGGGIPTLYALDLAGPKLSFKRPVDEDQLLAAVDDSGLYLVGPYFSFIDPQTHVLRWAPPLPTDGQPVQSLKAGNDFLVFTGRGIYRIDPAQQRMEIFRGIDVDSLGGSLLHIGNKLITVSNRAVTAYDIAAQSSAQ